MKRLSNTLGFAISGLLLASPAALAAEAKMAGDTVRYQLTFERNWTSDTFPKDFPLLAHFSPIIGASHAAGEAPFEVGKMASPGLKKLCEEGEHQPLDAEIRDEIKAGSAEMLIETTDPIRDEHGKAVTTVELDSGHPYVTVAAMIAPSPDWCAAAFDVDLRDGSGWVSEKRVDLYSYDVGTDSGTSYRSLDNETEPHAPIAQNQSEYFLRMGKPAPVGTLTFVRQ
jgi:hypothetical protein